MSELRKGANIAARLAALAGHVFVIVDDLPKNAVATHVAKQLVRAATSAGANYEEARAAESRADFIHKLGIAVKEIRETIYWLELVHVDYEQKSITIDAIDEAQQLAAILYSSQRTARLNAPRA